MSMRDSFRGFYTKNTKENSEIYKSEDTLFVFDTNVLLDLYRNNPETISAIKKTIEEINDRVFLPYFTALEYQRRRLGVIDDQKHLISSTTSPIIDIINLSKNHVDKCLNTKARHYEGLNKQVIDLLNKSITMLNTDLETMFETLHESIDELNTKDIHREWIDSTFLGKLGKKKTQEQIDSLDNECIERYNNKIPPGFCDIDKKKSGKVETSFFYDGIKYDRAYGDFYIWMEILEHASNENIKNVFLVTNDAKDDFIFKVGRDEKNKENKGVHAILREEILNKSNVESFDILNTKELILNVNQAYSLGLDTENLNISTGNGYVIRNKISSKDYKIYLRSKISRLTAEISKLSRQLSLTKNDDIEEITRIRLLIKGKLLSIAKAKNILTSIPE
ncbi:TPA: DUF4935 domain-containing protein [Proteus mirabilis]|nr:DUF4935 domain-containing protein [Proteus mirabilis]